MNSIGYNQLVEVVIEIDPRKGFTDGRHLRRRPHFLSRRPRTTGSRQHRKTRAMAAPQYGSSLYPHRTAHWLPRHRSKRIPERTARRTQHKGRIMKNPNSACGARAFRVTSTATLNSSVDATRCPHPATHFERKFRWCDQSHSIQPVTLHKGCIQYV